LTAPAPLTPAHDLSRFNSGKPALDDWLRNSALESEGRTAARTYVVCENERVVVGYYCISTGSVQRQELPPKMKRVRGIPNQVPVAIIGRLARDQSYAGKELGKDLLQDALGRILAASQIVGVRAVLVHALDDAAARFWTDHEFIECPIDSRTFYLAVETIAGAI
jgi:predicted GNAT family N-acyltransferase